MKLLKSIKIKCKEAISGHVQRWVMFLPFTIMHNVLNRFPNGVRYYPFFEAWLLIAGPKAFCESMAKGRGLWFATRYAWFYWQGILLGRGHGTLPQDICEVIFSSGNLKNQ